MNSSLHYLRDTSEACLQIAEKLSLDSFPYSCCRIVGQEAWPQLLREGVMFVKEASSLHFVFQKKMEETFDEIRASVDDMMQRDI